MPRYFFTLKNGTPVSADGGEVLADDAEARKVAAQIARDFAKNKTALGRLRITVTNEAGDQVHEVFLSDVA